MKNAVINSDLANVLAPVNMVNASDLFVNPKLILPNGMDKAIKSGDKIYGFVSETFGLIKPSDVFDTFGSEFSKRGIPFETKGRIDQRGNFELRFMFENTEVTKETRKVGDQIRAMLAVGSGLAGTRSFYVNDMIERLVCLNGMTRTESTIALNKVRNTQNNHLNKLGVDFDLLMPLLENFITSKEFLNEQTRLIEMELKHDHILPFFYEVTKGTKFPESKFQSAFDRMQLEASQLGFTAMNRYLAYAGLNYILEHDSMAMNLVQTKDTDSVLASRVETTNIGMAVKNFNAIVKAENERISAYQTLHDGKSPRGKRKITELELVSA